MAERTGHPGAASTGTARCIAFLVMGVLWLFIVAMLLGIAEILRSKARGDDGWPDSPGL